MLKMFSTQLTGLFLRIKEKEEFSLEDGARLLAQAPAGEGQIYLKGFGEMEGVLCEAMHGAEPMKGAKELLSVAELSAADRAIIFSRYDDDEEAAALGRKLADHHIPFVSVGAVRDKENPGLANIADVHIDTYVVRPLLPAEDGSRVIFPSLIAGLFIYHVLKFTVDEILSEHE